MENVLLPTHPETAPILVPLALSLGDEVQDDLLEDEEPRIPPRSVPPHAPPQALSSAECELPSVIVDLLVLEEAAAAERDAPEIEAQRDSDIDVLLDESPYREPSVTLPSVAARAASSSPSRWRSVIVMLVAISVAGGTWAELAAHGVSTRTIGAALHLR